MTASEEPAKPASNSPTTSTPKAQPKRIVDVASTFALEQRFPSTKELLSPYTVSLDKAIISIDTNALLLPYRIGKKDLGSIEEVYKKLAAERRLFLPARTLREFSKHRDQHLADMIRSLNNNFSKINVTVEDVSFLLDLLPAYANLKDAAKKLQDGRRDYRAALEVITSEIRSWSGNDPVTLLYHQIFTEERVVEHEGDNDMVAKEWEDRLNSKVPPGYKDGGKEDSGIGDYLIWKSLLRIGKEKKSDLVFVTGEEKSDWFVRSGSEPFYPRPELVQEFRAFTGGYNIRLSSLADLLSKFNVADGVVAEVRSAEAQANSVAQASSAYSLSFVNPQVNLEGFDYSMNDGTHVVRHGSRAVSLSFSKASDDTIYLERDDNAWISRVRNVPTGTNLFPESFDRTSRTYAIGNGEVFMVGSKSGDILAGRIVHIQDDTRGYKNDYVTFSYSIFGPNEQIVAP